MSLSDLASLGSFVSGVAVLASLVFLFFQMRQVAEQVRQSERNQRSEISSQSLARETELVLRFAEQPLADLYRRMLSDETKFTETEVLQMINMLWAVVFIAMDDVGLREDTLISRTTAEFNRNLVRLIFARPLPRALWPMVRREVPDAVRSVIERYIQDAPVALSVGLADRLTRNLSRVNATQDANRERELT